MEEVPEQPLPDAESTVAIKQEEDNIAGPSTTTPPNTAVKRRPENNDVLQGTKKCNYSNNYFELQLVKT